MTSAAAVWKMFMDVHLKANAFLAESFQELNLVDISSLNSKYLLCAEETNSASRTQGLEDLLRELKDLKIKNHDARKKISNKENINDSANSFASTVASDESSRPRRKAAVDANDRVNIQINASLKDKLRQEKPTIKIKQERLSEVPEVHPNDNTVEEAEKSVQEMPPPAVLPKRAGRKKKEETIKVEKTRPVRSRKNKNQDMKVELLDDECDSIHSGKRSDVVLIPQIVPTINVEDEREEDEYPKNEDDSESEEDVSKKARKALKKEASKRIRSPSSEVKKQTGPKRSKTKETPAKERSSRYEDAVGAKDVQEVENEKAEVFNTPPDRMSKVTDDIFVQLPTVFLTRMSKEQIATVANKPNATIIVSKAANETAAISKPNGNSTVVLEKRPVLNETVTLIKPTESVKESDIMTDDESEEEQPPVKPNKVNKQLFNPFEHSPLKKKVEAFEKLGKAAEAEATTRTTRTKTRQKAKAAEAAAEEKNKEATKTPEEVLSPLPKKPTYTTPINSNRYVPMASVAKPHLSSSAQKALNAIKLSSQQFRKHEQLRKEKEAAALQNKNKYLSEETEEKRRRREEKELKLKQHRAAMEEEKRRALEFQKAKEEKSKRILQNKQREETERRLLVKQKHDELMRAKEQRLKKKQEEEEKRKQDLEAKQRKAEEEARQRKIEEEMKLQALKIRQKQKETELAKIAEQPKPIFMTQPMPQLPTTDCYDSDEENPKPVVLPSWNTKEAVRQRMKAMAYIQSRVYNTLYCVKAQTPNPQELFPMVDPRKLRRNSSAIWKQAPRFTMVAPIADDF